MVGGGVLLMLPCCGGEEVGLPVEGDMTGKMVSVAELAGGT